MFDYKLLLSAAALSISEHIAPLLPSCLTEQNHGGETLVELEVYYAVFAYLTWTTLLDHAHFSSGTPGDIKMLATKV